MDSESKLQGSRSNDRPVPVCVVPYTDQNNEISLIDLWCVIVARKMLVLLSLLVAILLAFAYVFWVEPSYRAEAYLLPPQQKDIQALMIDFQGGADLKVELYTPDLVFTAFLKNLKSKGLRREYFDINNLADYYLANNPHTDADIDRIFDKKFNGSMRVQSDKQNTPFTVVSFSDRDSNLAAQRLNQFINFANKRTARQLYRNANAIVQAEIKQIRDELSSKLKLAERRRFDTITVLKEAQRIADALGIKDASTFPKVMDKSPSGLAVNTAQVPLYMRGTSALETEISVLELRKSEEPFISGFRDLQEKLAFMEAISIDYASLSAVIIDDPARVPYRMEKPNKKMIAILSVVLGVMVGVFLALAAEFLLGTRRESRQ